MTFETQITQPVIPADRIVLRPLRPSDAGLIGLHAEDRRVSQMTTTIPYPLPPGMTEAFIARSLDTNRDEDVWAMDGQAAGFTEVVGLISLKRLDRRQSEIGYWVAPPFWNLGFATEAVRTILSANPHANETIFASVFQDNPASARVLTNAGFVYLGDAEAFSVARQANVPTWTYLKRLT